MPPAHVSRLLALGLISMQPGKGRFRNDMSPAAIDDALPLQEVLAGWDVADGGWGRTAGFSSAWLGVCVAFVGLDRSRANLIQFFKSRETPAKYARIRNVGSDISHEQFLANRCRYQFVDRLQHPGWQPELVRYPRALRSPSICNGMPNRGRIVSLKAAAC